METAVYPPSAEVIERARVKDYQELFDKAAADPEAYWENEARELAWFSPWTKTLQWDAPFAQWFVDARCNIAYNCLDRHVLDGKGDKTALIWESESGETRTFTYAELLARVVQFANVLRRHGVDKGDRVTIYMPRIPEQLMAILAVARLGAVHSVVFGGFSVDALRERIDDAQTEVVVTADGGWMNERTVLLKDMADQAVSQCPSVKAVVVVKHTGQPVHMEQGRDHWYHEQDGSGDCPCVEMSSEDPLFILYTSGTTGRPKGIQHVHGGYMVGVYTTFKNVFDVQDSDRYWCTADAGWVTGHSYVVYAPFLHGITQIVYEGSPSYPSHDRWWSIVDKYKVTILYTTPTAIRGLMKHGDKWPAGHDLTSLRLLGSVGEPINPEAWRWFYRVIGNERCPIMDTWWQTETGAFMVAPMPCVPLKPGTGTRPLPGIDVEVVDDQGNPVAPGQDGILVVRKPWPSMLRTIYKNPELYKQVYWSRIPGMYVAGDSARKDEDGYIWVMGRIDDVIKVSGYRLGTAEIESALVSHPQVAEAAVIGLPHEVKGQSIKAFVVLRDGEYLRDVNALRDHVGEQLSKVARPDQIDVVESLPKTRSGKIMRRVLKAQELGQPIGDTSTMED